MVVYLNYIIHVFLHLRLWVGGLCKEVVYIAFLGGVNLKWSLKTGGLYSQVVFNTS